MLCVPGVLNGIVQYTRYGSSSQTANLEPQIATGCGNWRFRFPSCRRRGLSNRLFGLLCISRMTCSYWASFSFILHVFVVAWISKEEITLENCWTLGWTSLLYFVRALDNVRFFTSMDCEKHSLIKWLKEDPNGECNLVQTCWQCLALMIHLRHLSL